MPNKNKCTPGITYNAVRKHKPNERYNTMELYSFFVGGQYQWILWLTLTNLRPYEF